MREKILTFIEKNSRVNLKDLAVMLGVEEAVVANEIADMEKEGIICGYHTLIDWDKTSAEKLTALIEGIVVREKILTFIEKNSRVNLKDLAVMLGVEEAVVANEIADMEKEGIICGYHTLIDWDKTSAEKLTALIEVKVTPQRGLGFDKVAERIYNYPEVDSVYLISGGFDFMVMIEGKTMRDVAQFVSDKLSPIESVLSTATHFILKKYKDHGSIMVHTTEDERMLVTP